MDIKITKRVDLMKKDSVSCVFGTMRAQQHHDAYGVFYSLIKNTRPKRILEIGTAQGGFICFLKLCIDNLGINADVRSYDIKNKKQYKDLRELGIDVRVENIFYQNYTSCDRTVVEYIQRDGTTVILCDGGNKIEEFKLLSKHIKVGDFILAHDYADSEKTFYSKIKNNRWNWCEITNDDIAESVIKYKLDHYMKDQFESVAWTCRMKI